MVVPLQEVLEVSTDRLLAGGLCYTLDNSVPLLGIWEQLVLRVVLFIDSRDSFEPNNHWLRM